MNCSATSALRAEALRRKLADALQYPAFVLLAACGVLMFFIMFVLPQFSAVLRDFGAKTDTVINTFFALSDFRARPRRRRSVSPRRRSLLAA